MSSSASNKTPRRVTEKQWHSRLQKGINAVLQLENAFVKTPRNLAAANMVTEMDLVIKTLQSTIGIFDSYHSRPGSILHETRFEYTPVYTDDSIPQGARSIKPVRWRAQLSKALEAISPHRTVHEDTPASLAPEDLHKAVEPAFIALHQVLFRFQARRERALRTPVATLAPETLREIFLYVAEINPPHEEDLGWLILDDVCVQWQKTLRAIPELWASYVTSAPVYGFEEMLRNTQSLPLTFVANAGYFDKRDHCADTHSTMKFICAHLGRAKELRLQLRQAPPEGVASDLRCKLVKKNRTWPLLERIDVEVETSIEENHECYIDWYSEDVLSLDFDKRTIVAPNLRQVRMHNVAMPWDPSSVTHLTISTDISVPHGRPRARDLVSQLTRSTNLEVLRIDGCLSRVPRTQTPLGERTTFPHLRKMMLGGTPRQCAFLLNYMDIPPTATLAFSLFLSEAKYAENEATPWEDDDEEAVVAVYTKQTGPFFSSLARCSPRHVTSVTWEDCRREGFIWGEPGIVDALRLNAHSTSGECGDLTMDLDNAMTVKLDQDEVVKKFVRRMRMEGVRVNWEGDLGNDEDEAETDPEDPEDGAEYEPEESADEDDAATESEDED